MSSELSKEVKLYFTAKGLVNAKILGTSCPILQLENCSWSKPWRWAGETEPIPGCLDPQWKEGIPVTFYFEKNKYYTIVVRDYVKGSIENDKVMGSVDFSLSEVVCAPGGTKTFDLDAGGTIKVFSEDVEDVPKDLIRVAFFGRNLRSMGTFGTSPYLVVMRLHPNGARTELWRTETKDSLSPNWRVTANLPVQEMHSGNPEFETLEVQCWGARSLRGDVSLGYFRCSIMDLWRAGQAKTGVNNGPGFRLLKAKNANLEDSYGDIYVGDIKWIPFPDFRKALATGEKKLNLITSIRISEKDTLNASPKLTKEAVQTICTPLMEFVPDKESSVFGYEAYIGGKPSEFFPLTETVDGKVSGGVDGILDAYTQFLSNCEHSKRVSDCLTTVKKVTALVRDAATNDSVYTVLVIFADSQDINYEYTLKAELEKTRGIPLHVVIVLRWEERIDFGPSSHIIHTGDEDQLEKHMKKLVPKLQNAFEQYYYDLHLAFDPSAVATPLV